MNEITKQTGCSCQYHTHDTDSLDRQLEESINNPELEKSQNGKNLFKKMWDLVKEVAIGASILTLIGLYLTWQGLEKDTLTIQFSVDLGGRVTESNGRMKIYQEQVFVLTNTGRQPITVIDFSPKGKGDSLAKSFEWIDLTDVTEEAVIKPHQDAPFKLDPGEAKIVKVCPEPEYPEQDPFAYLNKGDVPYLSVTIPYWVLRSDGELRQPVDKTSLDISVEPKALQKAKEAFSRC
ncbi:MAG: hypothetical protein QM632_03120 [Micrococcaceae bacterium]